MFFLQIQFVTSKVVLDSKYEKHCIRVASQFVEQLQTQYLKKLGILEKSQNWVETELCDRPPLKKTLVIAVKNYTKADIKVF